jgi:hypothetical protein
MQMADIELEWSRAIVVAEGTELGLRVPLTSRPDKQWIAEFNGLRISRHLQGAEWSVEGVAGASNEVIASRVLAGDEAAIREALDTMVALANARVAQIQAEEEAARLHHEEELARARQEAVDMTERFRMLDPTVASDDPAAVETARLESGFHDRMRVLGSAQQASAQA